MIIALDVDGTLYDGARVEPAAVAAVAAAAANGHRVVIVTGRVWTDLPQVIGDVLPHVALAVCEHGALIVPPDDPTRAEQLAPALPSELVAAVSAIGWRPIVVGQSTIGLPAEAIDAATAVCRQFNGYHVEDNKASIAIVPDGCDKGQGLTDAIARLDVGEQPTLAIGDAVNDIAMFAIVDVAIAVANAERSVIPHADEVTRHEFGAGVAEALGRHLGLAG